MSTDRHQSNSSRTTNREPYAGLAAVLDQLDEELLIVDRDYHVKFANLALRQSSPTSPTSVVSNRCFELFQGRDSPCGESLWQCPLAKVVQSGEPVTTTHSFRPTGSTGERHLEITMWPLEDDNGNIDDVVELRKDVGPEKTLRREATRRHHHLDALTRISCAVSGLSDLDDILDVALDTVLQIFGESIGGVLLFDEELKKLCYKVHRGLSAKFAGEMCLLPGEGVAGKVAVTGEPVLLEDISQDMSAARLDLIRAEGLRGFVSVPLKAKDKVVGVMNLVSYLAGQFSTDDMYLLNSIGYLLGTAVEQARLYEGLDDARERYQRLLREVLTVQEQERKRIARDLHDETSQELTAVTFNLQAINDMMGMGGVVDPQIGSMLKKTLALASHASSELTKLIRELRPTLLDTLGLPAAIRRLTEAKLSVQGVEVGTEFKGMDQRLPAETELVLFRITQEAISNIVKHAGANKVRIGLECTADRCILRVQDDGEGFDVHKLSRIDSYGRGAGLFSMKERVAMAGGECTIDSAPGQGTTVVADVPVIGNLPGKEE